VKENYLNFQRQKPLKNQYLPHSESKSYQINSIKSCSSRPFQRHQRHIPLPLKFLATIQFNLIFSEEIIQYSRTFAPQVQTPRNQAHAPLLVESFPKTPRTQSEASQTCVKAAPAGYYSAYYNLQLQTISAI
jgi:hypothetical protein